MPEQRTFGRSVNKKANRTFGIHIAAVLVESMAYFSHSAHTVVGHAVNDDRCAANAVTFVTDFVVRAFQSASAALNRTLPLVFLSACSASAVFNR